MLQWMGGSRRKVAVSHTSVKKRQKQYFEQRRQQQHQLTVGSESDINKNNKYPRENQSLDILNFLNLSTANPECKPSFPEDGVEVLDADFYSLKENMSGVGSSLNRKAETTSSKRTSLSFPDNHTNDCKKENTKVDLMDGKEQKLSIFNLVGDDHTTTNLEVCSPSEAHMSFSVGGLGKIDTKTPINSPQPSNRTFEYRCSSPWKDTDQPDTSNVRERLNDFEEDTILECGKMFQDDSHYGSPVAMHAIDGGSKHTFSNHLQNQYSDSRSYIYDIADFNNSRFADDEWNVRLFDNEEDSFYRKGEQPYQKESLNPNLLLYGKDYTQSCSYAEKQNRDYLETTWWSNIKDSPTRRSLIDHSFDKEATPDFDFDNVFDQPVWSSTVSEEDKDSLSLRSEESCSSSAVWTNKTPISQSETNTRQRKRDLLSNLGDKKYLNNGLLQESWEDWNVDDQHMKRQVVAGKQVRLSNPGKVNCTSQREGGLDAPYDWFAEGFTSASIRPDTTFERVKPYPFLNPKLGTSHLCPSRAPDSIPETWFPKFSMGATGDDDEDDCVNCLLAKHKSKLAGDVCSFENDKNEQSREVSHPKNKGGETSSSVAKSLSDENECHPNEEVTKARQRNRDSGEKTSSDAFQQMIMLERHTLQLVSYNKTLLLHSSKT